MHLLPGKGPAYRLHIISSVQGTCDMSTPVVLITGALTGIGRAAALAFARERNRVVVSGRHEDVGQGLAAELRGLGGEVEFFRPDLRHEHDVRRPVSPTVPPFARRDHALHTPR